MIRVKCKDQPPEPLNRFMVGFEYEGKAYDGGYEVKDGTCLYGYSHKRFGFYFEIIEDAPKPAILSGHVDTLKEIEERLGRSGADPLGIAVREIHYHLETIHQLVGARAQQIEICKAMLPMMDEVKGYLHKGKAMSASVAPQLNPPGQGRVSPKRVSPPT